MSVMFKIKVYFCVCTVYVHVFMCVRLHVMHAVCVCLPA